jgi:hypothetical protein
MIEENNENKLIEGEDFIIRPKVINALPKHHLKVIVAKAAVVIALMDMTRKLEV